MWRRVYPEFQLKPEINCNPTVLSITFMTTLKCPPSINLEHVDVNHSNTVNAYTYLIMGLSATGAFLAKRFHFEPTCFIFCFLAAPTASFLQKHEADTFIMSDFSRYSNHNIDKTQSFYYNSTLFYTHLSSK